MSDKLSEYHAYRKIIKLLLLFLGLWPINEPTLFYRILPHIQIFLNLVTALAILGFVKEHFTNVALVTKSLSIMASFITGILKIICINFNQKEAIELHKLLDPYFSGLLANPNLKNVVLDGVSTFRRLSWAVASFVFVSGTLYIITPAIFILHQHVHHVQTVKYILPYPGKYPWTVSPNGLLYKFHYVFESLATVSLFSLTSSVEPLFSLYIFQMCGQFREMSYNIRHATTNEMIVIRQCIIQYTKLMRCRDILQKIYGPIILWMMATNAVILCSVIFQLTEMKSISPGRALLFAGYVGTKLTQTFIYAWTGMRLTVESELYREAVYETNWIGNKRLMTSVIIMLSQKSLFLTACNFSIVSLDIFVMVLNTTLSYFFLLQTIQT